MKNYCVDRVLCDDMLLRSNLTAYGAAHAFVDMVCAAVILSVSLKLELTAAANYIILYNVLAFATQPLTGYTSDSFRAPKFFAGAGCVIIALAALCYGSYPLAAACLAGIGNSVFHVGAGAICLNLRPDKAAPMGVFVAPGAFGLMLGGVIGKAGIFNGAVFSILLLVLAVLFIFVKTPDLKYASVNDTGAFDGFEIPLILFLFTVAIRSFTGFFLNFSWKSDKLLLLWLTLAVVCGKAAGGAVSDRFGWRFVTVGGLITSSALITFGAGYVPAAIAGILLFNMTMPVTLVAVSNLLPGRPAFSFGLACLALILGALPAFCSAPATGFAETSLAFAVVILSAVVLLYALNIYYRKINVAEIT